MKSEAKVAAAAEVDEAKPAPQKEPPKPKKKRARKKAEKKQAEEKAEKDEGAKKKSAKKKSGRKKKEAAAAPSAPEPTAEPTRPAEDTSVGVDLDLDADGTPDAESLVAEVTVLEEAAAGEQAAIPVEEPEEEAVPVEDIDAVLDDDESEDLAALIAQTVAGAEPDDHPADEPVESLDEGLVAAAPAAKLELEEEPPPADPQAATATEPASTVEATAAEPEAAGGEEPEEEIDLTGAIDLGPEITQEIRDRLLAQALAHAEIQDARYRVPYADPRPAGRWKALVAAGLLLVAGILTAAPPAWVRPDPPARLDADGHARALRSALLLQSQQVDAFRVRNQRLPDSLDELPQRLPGLRYVRSGNRAYQLIGYEPDGNAVIYDSSNPGPEFGRLARGFEPRDAP